MHCIVKCFSTPSVFKLLTTNSRICHNSASLLRFNKPSRAIDYGSTQLSVAKFHTSAVNHLFWEADKKGGYDTTSKEKISSIQHIRIGIKELKKEIRLWKDEVKEKLECDPLSAFRPGEIDLVWCFDGKDKLEDWVTTSDSDHNQGFSTCSLEMSSAGRAIFSGKLDTKTPVDGIIKRSGYCNMRSKRHRKSFKRDSCFDWNNYNTFVMKVRGDGRSYILNLAIEGYYDLTWNDVYHYVLYTRGGPYWQIAKIPFSKFIFGSKGRIQDKQTRIPLDRITHVGIACGDKLNGDFGLEIEYIGLEFDPKHDEEFAYEMYNTDKYIVSV